VTKVKSGGIQPAKIRGIHRRNPCRHPDTVRVLRGVVSYRNTQGESVNPYQRRYCVCNLHWQGRVVGRKGLEARTQDDLACRHETPQAHAHPPPESEGA